MTTKATTKAILEFNNLPTLLNIISIKNIAWIASWGVLLLYLAMTYWQQMDIYEQIIFFTAGITLAVMGWRWSKLATAMLAVAVLTLISLNLYQNNLQFAEQNFWLKYILASQSAIMWMNALFVFATGTYLLGLFTPTNTVSKTASSITWIAMIMGYVGLLVRWHESYLISPEIGYIPVSNLYEVFILFCLITAQIYLHYEEKTQTYRMGFFSLLIISCAIGFILWYTFDRQGHHIKPLVPALNSYWMKIHVPANFIGYGCFAIAAMNSILWLIINRFETTSSNSLWLKRLPSKSLIEDINYRAIALGFAFFTLATILGALWAAEAWGGYWSWDPKETWALIVWLNYAAWLHFRISKGWNGTIMAWWSIIGLFVTLFAFLGVNMFLSGLHSYGSL